MLVNVNLFFLAIFLYGDIYFQNSEASWRMNLFKKTVIHFFWWCDIYLSMSSYWYFPGSYSTLQKLFSSIIVHRERNVKRRGKPKCYEKYEQVSKTFPETKYEMSPNMKQKWEARLVPPISFPNILLDFAKRNT